MRKEKRFSKSREKKRKRGFCVNLETSALCPHLPTGQSNYLTNVSTFVQPLSEYKYKYKYKWC